MNIYCRQDRVSAAEQRKEEQSRVSEANGSRAGEKQASAEQRKGKKAGGDRWRI
jgi:hypothetical protein